MTFALFIAGLVTLASALAAMTLRNLVHCALSVVVTFAGLAAMYLQLGAQFIGFAQILVYVGAVAILIVFAIMLTRGSEPAGQPMFSKGALTGAGVALVVASVLAGAILASKALAPGSDSPAIITVQDLGKDLMGKYVLPLEVLGLLLTAALIGAVIIALQEPKLPAAAQPDGMVTPQREHLPTTKSGIGGA